MRGLTLKEPWASLLVAGHKRIETRSWRTHYRGLVAIHASKSADVVKVPRAIEFMFHEAGIPMPEGWPVKKEEYPLGRIIAVGRLVDCRRMTPELIQAQSRMELQFGDWRPGRWAWYFEEMRRTTDQIEWVGALSVWKVPPRLEARIVA
jgi:hypothetical protein